MKFFIYSLICFAVISLTGISHADFTEDFESLTVIPGENVVYSQGYIVCNTWCGSNGGSLVPTAVVDTDFNGSQGMASLDWKK